MKLNKAITLIYFKQNKNEDMTRSYRKITYTHIYNNMCFIYINNDCLNVAN